MNDPEISIALSDPDVTAQELDAVQAVLTSPRLSAGARVEQFEQAFAEYLGRRYAVAVSSGTIAMALALKAYGIGPGDEVVASPYSWRETAHAITLAGAKPVFADIDYWAGTLVPDKAAASLTEKTKAVMVANPNGHPAPWSAFRALAHNHNLVLLEDSTEAIGSIYLGAKVGTFGDCAVFDFSQPGPLACGEGGMVVTDDADIAIALRRHRGRRPEERSSVVIGATVPLQAWMSDVSAALGLVQLNGLDRILARRKQAETHYFEYVASFEGVKDPYIAPDVDIVHWFLYVVHLGTRFSRSSRDAIIDDLRTEKIEAAAYCVPLHAQPHYVSAGYRRGQFLVTEKVADRAIALPFHGHLSQTHIAFIVGTMKDASINVGAGTAIYL
ncbi:MAG: DegT/DnrJ/EryC1/StrS family aminotransferase [Beijerinckiaceae bacterium]